MRNYSELGKLIASYSYQKNISFKEVAEQSNVSYFHLMNILNGTRNLDYKLSQRICNALQLNRDERNKIREAAYISNKKIVIPTKNKKPHVLKLLFLINLKSGYISVDQAEKIRQILDSN